ncbi:MAG: LLM class flavin-dependent oxidoreductase [Gammaproteobacteria bacterium]
MSRMQFGVFIPPHHVPTNYNPTLALQQDIEIVKLLDNIGYDEAWFGEHHSGGVELINDPMLFIAHVAPQTRNLRLGTGVVSLPYHNPLWVADKLALLDHLTRGRVILGVGPGALASDAAMIGIKPSEQRDALDFDMDVLMHLLTSDEPISVETSRYKLVEARLQLDFYQEPHPPIVAAAVVSPSGPRIAGKHGLGLISIGATMKAGVDVLAMHWDVLEARAKEFKQKADRDAWRIVNIMHLAKTKDQAIKDIQHGLKDWCEYIKYTAAAPQIQVSGNDISGYLEWIGDNASVVIGTYKDAIEHIESLIEISNGGFGNFLLFDHNWCELETKKQHYELFANYVIPHFKKTNLKMKSSEQALRQIRDPLAQAQQDAITEYKERHLKTE